jgi:hypothetical protein
MDLVRSTDRYLSVQPLPRLPFCCDGPLGSVLWEVEPCRSLPAPAHHQGTRPVVHRRCLRRRSRSPPRQRAGHPRRCPLHPLRAHCLAPAQSRANPVLHGRRRVRPSPRWTPDQTPPRRRRRHLTERMALARRHHRTIHGPPRPHRRRHRMGRPPHQRRVSASRRAGVAERFSASSDLENIGKGALPVPVLAGPSCPADHLVEWVT